MSFGKMVVSAISITGLFCPFFGVLFALAWSFYNQIDNQGDSSQSLAIYMGEAIGAAIGGLIFYYLFLPRFNSFTSAFIVSFFLLINSHYICTPLPDPCLVIDFRSKIETHKNEKSNQKPY